MARDPTLFAEKVGQHLTKCTEYRQIKKVIVPIDCTIRSQVHPSSAYTFIHFLVSKSQITKKRRRLNTHITLFRDDK